MPERRESPRFQRETLVEIELHHENGTIEAILGKTLNISNTGVLVETSKKIGDYPDALLSLAADDDIAEIGSIVIRQHRRTRVDEDGVTWYVYGLEFIEYTIEDFKTLLKYLASLSTMKISVSSTYNEQNPRS